MIISWKLEKSDLAKYRTILFISCTTVHLWWQNICVSLLFFVILSSKLNCNSRTFFKHTTRPALHNGHFTSGHFLAAPDANSAIHYIKCSLSLWYKIGSVMAQLELQRGTSSMTAPNERNSINVGQRWKNVTKYVLEKYCCFIGSFFFGTFKVLSIG